MNPWILLASGWLVMAAAMGLLWQFQRRSGKAGIVDVMWTAGVGLLGVAFALLGGGYGPRRLLIALMIGFWSWRLGSYLFLRVLSMHEDGRYEQLKREWGSRAQTRMFLFFQIQAFWSVLFAAPVLAAAQNPVPALGWPDALAMLVWLVSILGEREADRQLAAFRADPANRGRVCNTGLWRYSRHPNYFFEWVHWWSYVVVGWSAPGGWLTLAGPAFMLFFLLKVTGIPPTEANALASRGERYREYQRTTSVFFPWPPRKARA